MLKLDSFSAVNPKPKRDCLSFLTLNLSCIPKTSFDWFYPFILHTSSHSLFWHCMGTFWLCWMCRWIWNRCSWSYWAKDWWDSFSLLSCLKKCDEQNQNFSDSLDSIFECPPWPDIISHLAWSMDRDRVVLFFTSPTSDMQHGDTTVAHCKERDTLVHRGIEFRAKNTKALCEIVRLKTRGWRARKHRRKIIILKRTLFSILNTLLACPTISTKSFSLLFLWETN